MNKQEAVQAIITFETLPPQIDYTKPWQIKAEKGYEFLETLPEEEKKECFEEIEDQVNGYYTPGECGHSAAELDALF